MKPRQVHQILPFLAYGDAIGNQVLELRRLLRVWGFASEIFAENWDPRLANECRPHTDYARFSHPANLLILHYSIGGEVNRLVLNVPDQAIVYYHNITPPHFLHWTNGEMARQLEEARLDLKRLAGKVAAISASPYNASELKEMGFHVVGVAPYILNFEQLNAGAESRQAQELKRRFLKPWGRDWLYVGRLVPNKCIQDAIKAFYYYHTWISPASRLLLVGSGAGMTPYVERLQGLTHSLGLDEAVVFAGHYGAADGLAAFYQMADLYISMSEHEGFCIPLVEAMHYDLPVLAYASTGVPFTLGGAGVLIREKEYAVIAEMAHEILTNDSLRARLVQTQRVRLAAFAPAVARAQFHACLDAVEKIRNEGYQ